MTVTFFGHKDTPKEIEPSLRATLVDLIENHGATDFYVGSNGNFDTMVRRQLEELSKVYPITYSVVLAYLPTKKSEYDDYSNTILPEGIETTPKRFAISYRNKWMVEQSDIVVTYVTHTYGGAWRFKALAYKQGKMILELSE
ncbi:MAG: hypothetical protein UHM85_09990 [Acutalibacteraceae bacterium]|nr:hypothetical protein [Acutalibacteraceae bacterium]